MPSALSYMSNTKGPYNNTPGLIYALDNHDNKRNVNLSSVHTRLPRQETITQKWVLYLIGCPGPAGRQLHMNWSKPQPAKSAVKLFVNLLFTYPIEYKQCPECYIIELTNETDGLNPLNKPRKYQNIPGKISLILPCPHYLFISPGVKTRLHGRGILQKLRIHAGLTSLLTVKTWPLTRSDAHICPYLATNEGMLNLRYGLLAASEGWPLVRGKYCLEVFNAMELWPHTAGGLWWGGPLKRGTTVVALLLGFNAEMTHFKPQ